MINVYDANVVSLEDINGDTVFVTKEEIMNALQKHEEAEQKVENPIWMRGEPMTFEERYGFKIE